MIKEVKKVEQMTLDFDAKEEIKIYLDTVPPRHNPRYVIITSTTKEISCVTSFTMRQKISKVVLHV